MCADNPFAICHCHGMKNLAICLYIFSVTPSVADAPVVAGVTAQHSGSIWNFSVTVSHPDSGWDHYADGWEVYDADGNRLGLRVLAHPHTQEQPFTRSLSGVEISPGTSVVFIRTRCIVDGWSEASHEVALVN